MSRSALPPTSQEKASSRPLGGSPESRQRTGPARPFDGLLALHGTAGNRAVHRMLGASEADAGEREAERLSARIRPHSAPRSNADSRTERTPPLRPRQVPHAGNSLASAPPIVRQVLASSGRPLDAASRRVLEPQFGTDFAHVRVHTGDRAATSAAALEAHAYAFDDHVVFGSTAFQPNTPAGMRLLAHELTHVVQQQSAAQPTIQCSRWSRGEGIGPAPATSREHDLGNGMYWSDRLDVGADYAHGRGRLSTARGIRLLQLDVPEIRVGRQAPIMQDVPNMGRVLNIDADPRWHALVGDIWRLARPVFAGEVYSDFFGLYLGLGRKAGTAAIDAELTKRGIRVVIGPEYVRGGLQMVIRDPEKFEPLRRMQPVLSDVQAVQGVVATRSVIEQRPRISGAGQPEARGPLRLDVRIEPPGEVVTFWVDRHRHTVVRIDASAEAAPFARQFAAKNAFPPLPPGTALVRSPGPQLPVLWEPPVPAGGAGVPPAGGSAPAGGGIAAAGGGAAPVGRTTAPAGGVAATPVGTATSAGRVMPPSAAAPSATPPSAAAPGGTPPSAAAPGGTPSKASQAPPARAGGSSALRTVGGAAAIMSLAGSEFVARGTERQQEKAAAAVAHFLPEMESKLDQSDGQGAVVRVVYRGHHQMPGHLTFRWADYRIVSGRTLADAQEDYRRQRAEHAEIYAEPEAGEFLKFEYTWHPPLDTAGSPERWTKTVTGRGALDEAWDALMGFGARLLPRALAD